jgi:hypothetical protein
MSRFRSRNRILFLIRLRSFPSILQCLLHRGTIDRILPILLGEVARISADSLGLALRHPLRWGTTASEQSSEDNQTNSIFHVGAPIMSPVIVSDGAIVFFGGVSASLFRGDELRVSGGRLAQLGRAFYGHVASADSPPGGLLQQLLSEAVPDRRAARESNAPYAMKCDSTPTAIAGVRTCTIFDALPPLLR